MTQGYVRSTKQPMNTTNEITKAAVKTPILLRRTIDALAPEVREAFITAFNAEVAAMKLASEKAGVIKLVRPNNARECENLLKRTMRLS